MWGIVDRKAGGLADAQHIHETLRTIVKNNTDLFQENGNFTNCSIQLHPTKDKVLDVRYYLLHAVF